jgi:O-antigen/teichoic acid export membrane protein
VSPTQPHQATAGPSSDTQLAKIARGGALNLVGGVTAGISGFVLTVVVTHGWDPATAGLLFSATSLFLILSATGLLGTDTGLARHVLRYEAQGRGNDVSTVLKTALTPVVVVGVLIGLLLALAADTITAWVGLPSRASDVFRVFAVALPLAVLSDACLAATQAFGNMRATVVIDRLLRSGGQPIAAAVAVLIGVGLTGLSVAWALPYAVAAAISPVALIRTVRRRRRGQVNQFPARPAAEIRREFWSYTWLRGVARLFQVALQRSDIILVAALRSPAEAALYTAATRFVVLGQLGVMAIQQVLRPRLTEMLAVEDDAETNRVFATSTAWIMALSWPIYVTAIVAGPLYLGIFGEEYVQPGELVVVLMGLGMLLAMAAGPVDVVLLMAGRSALSLFNNGAALAVNIALNLVLIPRYGINGAAASWAIALGVRNVLPFIQVRRTLGLRSLSRAMLIVSIASVGCFALPMLALRFTVGLDVLPAVLVLLLSGGLYLAVLWHWRNDLELQALRRARRGGQRRAAKE